MDLTVNLFTSFGYFDHDEEHVTALHEMVGTLRPGGWFVIDFLNPSAVRRNLVSSELVTVNGKPVQVRRELSGDGHHVTKTIETGDGRRFCERVRLFDPEIRACWPTPASGCAAVRRRRSPLGAEAPRTILAGQRQ
jgi:hypothetical protein